MSRKGVSKKSCLQDMCERGTVKVQSFKETLGKVKKLFVWYITDVSV